MRVTLPVTIAGVTYVEGEMGGERAIRVVSGSSSMTGRFFRTREPDMHSYISVVHDTCEEAHESNWHAKEPLGAKSGVLYRA